MGRAPLGKLLAAIATGGAFLLVALPFLFIGMLGGGVSLPMVLAFERTMELVWARRNVTPLTLPSGPLGSLLETFVTVELRKQQAWASSTVDIFHFRDRGGTEVDLVLEARDGRVAGIEVKAARSVAGSDFKGLRLMRDRLGDQFVGGVVLYRGQQTVPFGENLLAVPVAALWELPG